MVADVCSPGILREDRRAEEEKEISTEFASGHLVKPIGAFQGKDPILKLKVEGKTQQLTHTYAYKSKLIFKV